MSEFLTGKGYQVFGLVRGQNNPKAQLVQDENPTLELVEGDLRDLSSLIAALEQVQPDEVYNLGAGPSTPGIEPDREFWPAGQGTGAIHELVPAGELVGRFVTEAEAALDGATALR